MTTATGYDHLDIWRWKLPELSFVYVLKASHDTPIKVGYAKDVTARIAELQTGNPRRLNLLYVVPGDRQLEAGLHLCLPDSRLVGEWFDGPAVQPFKDAVAKLADAMIAGHDETGDLPDPYVLAKGILPDLRRPDPPAVARKQAEIAESVNIDPAPPISKEERQRRLHEHWMRPRRPKPDKNSLQSI